jgi:ferrochelatase
VNSPIGILCMAYGTASGPEDVERYYTDIRGGRPPSPDHLAELEARYAAIGNRFPLLDITREQAAALQRELNEGSPSEGAFRTYLGMKHSPPFIAQGVEEMRRDGIDHAVGLVLAPHWSGMSVETYVERVEKAVAEEGGPAFTFIRQWFDHPSFVEFLASRVEDALRMLDDGTGAVAPVIFSAHSLPTRTVEDGSRRCKHCALCEEEGCRYVAQLERTVDLVANELLRRGRRGAYAWGWQSAGRTGDPWWIPSVEEVIGELAQAGYADVVCCSAGFVADHLETLYDLDIEARRYAENLGLRFARTQMPNADPAFVRLLAQVIRGHLDHGFGARVARAASPRVTSSWWVEGSPGSPSRTGSSRARTACPST